MPVNLISTPPGARIDRESVRHAIDPCIVQPVFEGPEAVYGTPYSQEGESAKSVWLLQEGELLAIRNAVQWERLSAPALVGERWSHLSAPIIRNSQHAMYKMEMLLMSD